MNQQITATSKKSKLSLAKIIGATLKIPGVKVNRDSFLRSQFKDLDCDEMELIIEKGPVYAGIERKTLKNKAALSVAKWSALSTSVSFAAGIPSGMATLATIPLDAVQFYAVSLRMAQEIAYLYGEKDLFEDEDPQGVRVANKLIIYLGVMLGFKGAVSAVRIMASQLAKKALRKISDKLLSKILYNPIIKFISKFFTVSMAKGSLVKSISKLFPLIGGAVCGGITMASMSAMGLNITKAFDKARFDYNKEDFIKDLEELQSLDSDVAERIIVK